METGCPSTFGSLAFLPFVRLWSCVKGFKLKNGTQFLRDLQTCLTGVNKTGFRALVHEVDTQKLKLNFTLTLRLATRLPPRRLNVSIWGE